MSIQTIGIGVDVPGVASDELRVNTRSAYDFAYWAGKFIVEGTPSNYLEPGPETDGLSLVLWAAGQVGVSFVQNFSEVDDYVANTRIPIEKAFRTRGAILVCTTRVSISAGLGNIIDVINGRYFMYKPVFTPQSPVTCIKNWQYAAKVPGMIY